MAEAAPSLSMLVGTSCTIDFTVPEGLVLTAMPPARTGYFTETLWTRAQKADRETGC